MSRLSAFVFCLFIANFSIAQSPIQVADGFKVTKVADDSLATNIYSLTVDSEGHPVVAGPGYVKRLLDKDRDGIYDNFQLVSQFPANGAQGLFFDGSTLYAVGDQGVLKMTDQDQDGVCDPPTVVYQVKTGGEHDAHAIRKGKNGKWYLLCGNGVPAPPEDILTKPVLTLRNDNSLAGYLLELEPDFSSASIVSFGFRNAYDFDFNSVGEVFTYDSDGERDVSMPWYRPTRVYRLNEGCDAGWVTASWKHPDYAPTMPEVIGRHGRGSPTGVTCYRHDQFPVEFKDAVFVLDWTIGRILVHKRDPSTGDYDQGILFAAPRGAIAFAVTDCEVAADGSLLVSVGGRGTEGAVYRIESINKREPQLKSQPSIQSGKGKELTDDPTFPFELTLLRRAEIQFRRHLNAAIPHQRAVDKNWPAVFDGYLVDDRKLPMPSIPNKRQILSAIKSSQGITLHEWARRLAVSRVSSPSIRQWFLNQITRQSDPVEDIHILICLTRSMKEPTTQELRQMVDGLLSVRPKLFARQLNTDRNWPIRMRELAKVMMREFHVAEMIANHPAISIPENFYLVDALPKAQKELVQMQIADAILLNPDQADDQQISFLAGAPSNIYCGIIRAYSSEVRLTDSVIRSLARSPIPDDRECFLRGFKSANRDTWRLSAIGLRKLKLGHPTDSTLIFQKASLLGPDKSDQRVQNELFRYLRERYQVEEPNADKFDLGQWGDFLQNKHPNEYAKNVLSSSGSGAMARLSNVNSANGDLKNGRLIYDRLLCAKCHDSGNRLGPSLAGIANRFSDKDILNAIVNPDQQVPVRYRALKVLTAAGDTFFGSVVYESADGIVMTDRQTNTLRIDQRDIEARAVADTSLMPSGLLDETTEEEFADLMAYLKSIK